MTIFRSTLASLARLEAYGLRLRAASRKSWANMNTVYKGYAVC